MTSSTAVPRRLSKDLGLFDVYAISTGAMFSSGFFLLPGLAAAQTGPSVALAYLVAGIFIVPAMLSVAELSTAMPRAGGAYYFLDRALGPLMGTVGGFGTWLALVLKSAFALVGLGAYLTLYVDVPIKPLAVTLTLLFMVVNILGAKETTALQRLLVGTLLGVLVLFIADGLFTIASGGASAGLASDGSMPFLTAGFAGFMGTVGFVFVSYAGLTQVASVSEEVRNPDRNIPLGMFLSLATAAFVYAVGVWILVKLVDAQALFSDLTPIATAGRELFDWMPAGVGLGLIVVAAVAAFASTGNAGILSASRYPLAMARDRLVPERLAEVGRFGTPALSILLTSGLLVAAILLLDVESIAKLASAFQLLLFAFLSLAVIIMRESRIEGYDPGFRSPGYPWVQIFGLVTPFWLIAEMGELAVLFTLGLIAVTLIWFFRYAYPRVERSGAIFHAFAQLGTRRFEGLDTELRMIARERGLRDPDSFDELVARAPVLDLDQPVSIETLAFDVAGEMAREIGIAVGPLTVAFREALTDSLVPVASGALLPHVRLDVEHPSLALVRVREGLQPRGFRPDGEAPLRLPEARIVIFMVSPESDPGRHLRILGHIATHLAEPDFLQVWAEATSDIELREALVSQDRLIVLDVGEGPMCVEWAGRKVQELGLPQGCLVTTIRRDGRSLVPGGGARLEAGDRVTVLGERDAVDELLRRESFGPGPMDTSRSWTRTGEAAPGPPRDS